MHIAIPPLEPTQAICLLNPHQPLHHLIVLQLLCAHKIIQHLRLIDEAKYRGYRGRLTRKEWMASTPVHYTCHDAEESKNDKCECKRYPERSKCLLARINS